MNRRTRFSFFLFLLALSCNEDREQGTLPELSVCDTILASSCRTPQNVPYCTFGYKFGDNNPYKPSGPNIAGPKSGATLISFRFMDPGIVFKTHSQNAAVSLEFSEEDKSIIRDVIREWASAANIDFIEKSSNQATNITIISAFIYVSGLGYTAFNELPCKQIAGYLILNSHESSVNSGLILHEMGHVLGLGHVLSNNVMKSNSNYDHLQSGDIAGIQSIYGSK
jgi:hypothetical protein